MRRVPITLLPLLLVVGALAVPPCAFACSCAQAPSLEVVVSEWGNSVFVGRAGPRTGRQIVFTVERWYAGAGAAPVVALEIGDSAMCGLDISPGDHLVLTATRTESGSFQPSICSPWAAMNTPEAAKLIAEAESLYGAGVAPSPSTIPLDGPVGGEGSGASSPVVLIGVAAAASGAVLLGLLILVRRRRSDA